jgi:hypothetical protein
VYVNAAASGEVHDGEFWDTAFHTIRDAMAAAAPGNEIWVTAGVYRERDLVMKEGVALYGGFAGRETSREERDFAANITILDGDYQGRVLNILPGARETTRVDGFTIRYGKADEGAGIYCANSSPMIVNNNFLENSATTGSGGAIYLLDSSASIQNNVFFGNTAKAEGGAVYFRGASPVLLNNTVARNTAIAGAGGIAMAQGSAPVIANNIVAFNSSGIAKTTGRTPTLGHNIVYANGAENYGGLSAGQTDISVDPVFADVEMGNLRLNPASPAVDAGDDTAALASNIPGRDLDGRPRLIGSHIDIGAYEAPFSLVVDRSSVRIADGGTATFRVRLSHQPLEEVTVSLARAGGEADISPQPILVFGAFAWNVYQDATLTSVQDTDTDDGSSMIRATAPGWVDAYVSVVEIEPPRVTGVLLNGCQDRGISCVEPGGMGIRTIEVQFSQPVTFNAGDIELERVRFPNGQEQSDGTALDPEYVMGSGTDRLTITFAGASVVDSWVKVRLRANGTLRDSLDQTLDGEARLGARQFVYQALDLPTGDGLAGGDAVFYVGSLRGDFNGDLAIGPGDLPGFRNAWLRKSLDADFRGVGFGPRPPDGRITLGDIDGFTSAYQRGMSLGLRLDALPGMQGPASVYAYDPAGSQPLVDQRGDLQHAKLTDGLVDMTANFDNPGWVGIQVSPPQGGPIIDFDLGASLCLGRVNIAYLVDFDGNIHAPKTASVTLSNNGDFSEPLSVIVFDNFDDTRDENPAQRQGEIRTAAIHLGPATARYLRLELTTDAPWLFLGEVVFGVS